MTLQKAIKTAIDLHSKKYKAAHVWKILEQKENDGNVTLWIEVAVKPRKQKQS